MTYRHTLKFDISFRLMMIVISLSLARLCVINKWISPHRHFACDVGEAWRLKKSVSVLFFAESPLIRFIDSVWQLIHSQFSPGDTMKSQITFIFLSRLSHPYVDFFFVDVLHCWQLLDHLHTSAISRVWHVRATIRDSWKSGNLNEN